MLSRAKKTLVACPREMSCASVYSAIDRYCRPLPGNNTITNAGETRGARTTCVAVNLTFMWRLLFFEKQCEQQNNAIDILMLVLTGHRV